MSMYIFRAQYGVFPSQALYAIEGTDMEDAKRRAQTIIPVRRASQDRIEYVGQVLVTVRLDD